jgi:secreted Zn-dependent insulinase-like peptidase
MLNEDLSTFPCSDVHEALSYMNVDNMIVERLSQSAWEAANKDAATVIKKEKWYGVEYALTPIDSLLQQWRTSTSPLSSSLSLPTPNCYIPRSLTLHPSLPREAHKPRIDHPIRPPVLADDDPTFGRLFYRLDDRYALPKASLTILLRNAHCQNSFDSVSNEWKYDMDKEALTSMFTSIFYHSLAQETYSAEQGENGQESPPLPPLPKLQHPTPSHYTFFAPPEAGLGWSFSTSSTGLTLKIHGYSDRLSAFASKLLALAIDPHHMVEEKLVEILKERKVRSLRSFLKERPDAHCNYYINSFLDPSRGDIDARADAASRITASHLREHLRAMLKPSNMFVEVRTGRKESD